MASSSNTNLLIKTSSVNDFPRKITLLPSMLGLALGILSCIAGNGFDLG
ncbi:hypothetical protein OIU77_006527 [Salix suchowensis]|uniref:Uncharacterized protein n=1 Tax=Salix suchowensis TaxID=1278906 RepID=A0ABQ9AM36_9ROSI|nr:hypothetical protein OIU77_006527 [Salix suchowensis]